MTTPWLPARRLPEDDFARLRQRAIFDCCKWDPQVEDVCTIAAFPLLLSRDAWNELVSLAQSLARETLAAEAELLQRPELLARLGLPRRALRALERVRTEGATAGLARLMRFDFHFTSDGWRISEVNSDVPGGLNEASGIPPLIAPWYPEASAVGHPADAYVDELLRGLPSGATVALLHATAYSDDSQMMTYLARRLAARGARGVLASPAAVRWRNGVAEIGSARPDALVRFFPADWLADLPWATGWPAFYAGGRTPVSNPATALVTQSKRWPLVWDALHTPLPAWRALLPETRDPRDVPWRTSDEWVVKPVLGRVGEDVAIPGLLPDKEWRRVRRDCGWHPGRWVAQRRFRITPLELEDGAVFPCAGMYTVGERVIGAYGRVARRPMIDGRAEDAAILCAAAG